MSLVPLTERRADGRLRPTRPWRYSPAMARSAPGAGRPRLTRVPKTLQLRRLRRRPQGGLRLRGMVAATTGCGSTSRVSPSRRPPIHAADARTVPPPRRARTASPSPIGRISFRPTLAGTPLPLKRYERSRSLAIHPGGDRFVLGTELVPPRLRRPTANNSGSARRRALAWAVNIIGRRPAGGRGLRRRYHPLAPHGRRAGAAGVLSDGGR